jgi:murein DD-endopeptidase MepM/ murein hydrolase activator NlpD
MGMDFFNAYVDNYYDSSADYWKLIYDNSGYAFLEYDGRAGIYDENDNFLVGAGTDNRFLQSALGKYLGVDFDEAGKIMSEAGLIEVKNSWITSKNDGKKIRIGHYTDQDVTDYIYAAHRIGNMKTMITDALFQNKGNPALARDSLLLKTQEMDSSRYLDLYKALINFYLPDATMYGDIGSKISGYANEWQGHKGIDIVPNNGRGTIFNTIFSGMVIRTEMSGAIYFENYEAFQTSRESDKKDAKWYQSHHDDRRDENGNILYVYDANARGNSVTIEHGIMFNDTFISMGFYSRSNHFDLISENVTIGSFLTSGTGIGTTGNTGWSTGPHVDYNIFHLPNTSNTISYMYSLGISHISFEDFVNNRYNQYVDPRNLWNWYK